MAEQPAIEPMHQFLIHKIVQGPVFHVGGIEFDMSITNSVVSMIVGALIIVFLIAEPNGLARLWQIAKQKLRVWPFPY